jgi:hypothetical protein
MEAASTSEMSANSNQTTQRNNPEDGRLHISVYFVVQQRLLVLQHTHVVVVLLLNTFVTNRRRQHSQNGNSSLKKKYCSLVLGRLCTCTSIQRSKTEFYVLTLSSGGRNSVIS